MKTNKKAAKTPTKKSGLKFPKPSAVRKAVKQAIRKVAGSKPVAPPAMTKTSADVQTKALLDSAVPMAVARSLKDTTIGLRLITKRFGNKKKGDMDKVATDAQKNMLVLTKTLLDSPEIKAIAAFDLGTQIWLAATAHPSYLMASLYRIPVGMMKSIHAELLAKKGQRTDMVARFLNRYESLCAEAEAKLGSQFNRADYPPVDEVARRFEFEFYYMDIDSVPDQLKSLDKSVYEQACKDAESKLQIVAAEMRLSMTATFQELLDHLVDRLTPGPDGKPKIFRDSLVENMTEFFDAFPLRDATNFTALASIIERSKKVLKGIDPESLRNPDSQSLRDSVKKQIAAIKSTVDSMVITQSRAIGFSAEDI